MFFKFKEEQEQKWVYIREKWSIFFKSIYRKNILSCFCLDNGKFGVGDGRGGGVYISVIVFIRMVEICRKM